MPDLGDNDPLSVAVRGRGSLYALDSATQPGQNPLDHPNSGLVNQAIDARGALEAQRQQLIGQLGSGNRRQASQIKAALQGVNRQQSQLNWEDNQRRLEAHDGRMMAHQSVEDAAAALKTDRERSIDEQGASLIHGLGRLDAMHRNGDINDEQYNSSLLDLGQQHGLGLRHPEAGKMYEHFIGEADRRDQFNLRRVTSEATKLAGRYGIEPQVDEDGRPSIEATKQAALQTPKGREEFLKQMNDELYQKYGNPLGVGSLFNPIAPHSSPDEGKTINLPYADKKTGKLGALPVPADTFNQMKSDFQDRYFSVFPQQQSPAAQQPAQGGGLQAGATRNVGGKDYSWNGNKWEAQ